MRGPNLTLRRATAAGTTLDKAHHCGAAPLGSVAMGGGRLPARSAVELLLWLPTPLPCSGCASIGADGVGARGKSACAAHLA